MRKKGRSEKKAGIDTAVRKEGPSASIDDLAARLLQLAPSDREDLEEIKEGLLCLARDDSRIEVVRNLAAESLLKLDEMLWEKASVPDDTTLAAVAELLDRAIQAQNGVDVSELAERAESNPEDRLSADASPPFPSELPVNADNDLLADFVTESTELVEAAEASLLALEVDPDDQESVNTVFRAFHTIKGISGFLGLAAIKELAHRAESLLSRIRDREIRYSGGYADLALKSVDVIKELIDGVRQALEGKALTKPSEYDSLFRLLENPAAAGVSEESPMNSRVPRLGDILVSQGTVDRETVEKVVSENQGKPLGTALVKSGAAKSADVARVLRAQRKINQPTETTSDYSVRVRTDRLDRLIDMVGELVIAHSMVAQDETLRDDRHQNLSRKAARVGKIVRELQDLGMSLRMVPLKPLFQRIHRLARDLSNKAGKRVSLITHGEDTEIDRSMVDVIKDPLVHMVRNAVDHGIEAPDERIRLGKPEGGNLTLSAFHSGGSVVVELRDDGRGLDKERILDKAAKAGLINPESTLSDAEIFNLIFRPGFSTTEKVTDVSGRGVGMDVVRRNIEALRGRVEISSEWTQGACFKMVLPLTMAITDGMLVQAGAERYIVPTVNIVKTFQPKADDLFSVAGRGEMVMMRGSMLPIYRLHRLFGVETAVNDPTEGLLVILASGESRYALLVDGLLGQQQLVVKSLSKGIGKVKGVSGAAILGDGRVGLILDTAELAALATHELLAGGILDSTAGMTWTEAYS